MLGSPSAVESLVSKSVLMRFCTAALLSMALLSGCGGDDDPPPNPPTTDGGTNPGNGDGGSNPGDGDGGSNPGDGGNQPEVPPIVEDPVPDPGPVQTDPNNPNNAFIDSDCDGLSDAEEYAIVYGPDKLKTDPGLRDTDGDGIRDGVEVGRTSSVDPNCVFFPDEDPTTVTSPVNPDTDGDGIPDGLEDLNRNGKRDLNETDPTTADSDGDGLLDGEEDANRNGVVSPGETDPRKRDTDGDGASDGHEVKVMGTNPLKADTDGDGCTDTEEDKNQNGVVDPGETDPKLPGDCGVDDPDSDGDGIPDSVERATGTDPNNPDTDGDGLPDGVEDKNRNGRVDTGETDPRKRDTDCDGLLDGPNQGNFKGEDLNANGIRDATETDPTNPDTDGDGLLDGVERGVATGAAPVTDCGYVGDADPSTTTDPLKADTDGDGIADGAEDTNQNGRVDPGELNPRDASDGAPGTPAGQACSASNLRVVTFKEDSGADIRLALRPSFGEVVPLVQGDKTVGFIGYDSASKVTFIAYKRGRVGSSSTPAADESGIRGASFSDVSIDYTQTFTTWDGFPAVVARYTGSSGSQDLKAYTNALARSVASGTTGSLSGSAGASGSFKMQAQYVHRSNDSVVVVLALTPSANYTETGSLFTMTDTAGGSALAQFGDADAVQCETFTASTAVVDFLFVVDDSGSMANSQTYLAQAANEVERKLQESSIDWRLGMVTTTYPTSGRTNYKVLRNFTNNINQFKAWLTQNSTCSNGQCTNAPAGTTTCSANTQCWVGINGSGTEKPFLAAQQAVQYITASTTTNPNERLRPDAKLVIVVLTDTADFSGGNINDFINFFANPTGNPANQKIGVHGIICPYGQTCGQGEDPNNNTRLTDVFEATGGVYGSIRSESSITTTINAIVDSVISSSGYKTLKPPIGASMRVAVSAVLNPSTCPTKEDLPRSRTHGFDVDGLSGAVSFFGGCRPAQSGQTQAALSYRYWVDRTSNPNGSPLPCSSDRDYHDPRAPDFCSGKLVCNRETDLCECPADCGGGGEPGQVCNTDREVCAWECAPDCGGACGAFKTCDMGSCSCSCVQSATCAPGFKFDSSVCGCVCDTEALGCGSAYNTDPATCSCICKSDCGGCPANYTCNTSYCACIPPIN